MAQQLDEPLDTRVPESFVVTQPLVGALERARVDAAVVDAPAHGTFHESGPLEGLDVLRRRRERHPVWRRQLADGLLAPGEPAEHRAPGMVAQGAEDDIEACLMMCLMMFNHMVERIT